MSRTVVYAAALLAALCQPACSPQSGGGQVDVAADGGGWGNGPVTPRDGGEALEQAEPCLEAHPDKVVFGPTQVGASRSFPLNIESCGGPLKLYEVALEEGASPAFSVDLDSLDHVPSGADPVVLPAGGLATVLVRYEPVEPRSIDADGSVVLEQANLVIASDRPEGDLTVPILGAGVASQCPEIVIECAEQGAVFLGMPLHLHGGQSNAVIGEIEEWQWTVEAPEGSVAQFLPAADIPDPEFTPDVLGTYKFNLAVVDSAGSFPCQSGQLEVVVLSDEGFAVQLLWYTPEDEDPGDTGPGAGADMDLHLLHSWAAGPDLDGDGAPDGWYDIPFDCFWFNSAPNWGSYDPGIDDDPHLWMESTSAPKPEVIHLAIPENVTYRVGAAYWDHHGFGASYATVRVYVEAELVFEVADVLLTHPDMWEVAIIEWPSGKVQVVTDDLGQYKITPNYQNPHFY